MVVTLNTGLLVLTVLQPILARSLSNLVMRIDTPLLMPASVVRTLAPFLRLSDNPLIGQVPPHVILPSSDQETADTMSSSYFKVISGVNPLTQVMDRLNFILYVFTILISMGTHTRPEPTRLLCIPASQDFFRLI